MNSTRYSVLSFLIIALIAISCSREPQSSSNKAVVPVAQATLAMPSAPSPQELQATDVQVRVKRGKAAAVDLKTALLFKASVITSQLTATVMKNGDTPVKGTLNLMNGSIDLSGANPAVKVVVDLSSWNSNLLERDDRVRQVFFDTAKPEFAMATLTIPTLDAATIATLRSDGKVGGVAANGTLSLHGVNAAIGAKLNVGFNAEHRLAVMTAEPIVLKITDFGLSDNLQALITLCGHKSVSDAVKVDVAIEFEAVKF